MARIASASRSVASRMVNADIGAPDESFRRGIPRERSADTPDTRRVRFQSAEATHPLFREAVLTAVVGAVEQLRGLRRLEAAVAGDRLHAGEQRFGFVFRHRPEVA